MNKKVKCNPNPDTPREPSTMVLEEEFPGGLQA